VIFHFNGNGQGFELRLSVTWKSLVAFLKAALLAIGSIATLLYTSKVIDVLALFR
jgi:hypothetical protein